MPDDKILKGVVRNLAQLGVETIEKASEEGQKIVESIITGKELLGLERTMTDGELEIHKQKDKIKSQDEINRLKGQMSGKEDNKNGNNDKKIQEKPRNIEEELTQLKRQKEKEEGEKQKYYEEQEEERRKQREKEQAEYFESNVESTNPSKQKKSRGSAFANKKKHKPDTSQTSATQEYKGGGKID